MTIQLLGSENISTITEVALKSSREKGQISKHMRRRILLAAASALSMSVIGKSKIGYAQGEKVPQAGKDKVTISYPKPIYISLSTSLQGVPVVMVVNGALRAFRERDVFPYHLEVSIAAKELADKGMPSRREQGALDRVGDSIEALVLRNRASLFLARYTWNGLRRLLYYVHDAAGVNALLQQAIKDRKPEREWDFKMFPDPEWQASQPILKLIEQAKF